MNNYITSICMCLLFANMQTAYSAVVNYTEPTHGDLAWGGTYGDYLNLGSFDVGANIINGVTSFNASTGADDFDGFRFSVIGNMTITGATLSYGYTDDLVGVGFHFLNITNNDLTDRPFIDSPTTLLTDIFPQSNTSVPQFDIFNDGTTIINSIGPGDYIIYVGSLSATSGTQGGSMSYSFEFQVSSVPLPASLCLLISGLLSLFFMAKKSSNN